MSEMRLPSRKHHKTKIGGRNASAHGHTARTHTTRWDMPLNEQSPRKKTKHNIIDDASGPIVHFGRKTDGITYKITNARNYIWICNAKGCIFETHGKTYPANKKSILGQIANHRETHLVETNSLYYQMTLSGIET